MKKLKTLLLFILLCAAFTAQSQSKWTLGTTVGASTENNLGDNGIRLSEKVSRHVDRWYGFMQIGLFQMLNTNEYYDGDFAYLGKRSLSTTNIDLGGGVNIFNREKFKLYFDVGLAYRNGRQLWPEREIYTNGVQQIYYTYEKFGEFGHVLGFGLNFKVSEKIWLTMDVHNHSYNYFGEYQGVGIGANIML